MEVYFLFGGGIPPVSPQALKRLRRNNNEAGLDRPLCPRPMSAADRAFI